MEKYRLIKAGYSLEENLPEPVLREMHFTIKKVTEDIETLSFNTAISQMMIFSNTLREMKAQPSKKSLENLLLLLAPFAPHLAEECWSILGHTNSISFEKWPTYDENLCIDSVVTVAVQVNGKLRGTLKIEKETSQEKALDLALSQASVTKYTEGQETKKIVYVPGKILNIVVTKPK